MHVSSVEHAPEDDEFEVTKLAKAPSMIVRPPRVAEAPASMECVLDRIISMGDVGDHVVFDRVVRFHIKDDFVLSGGRIDTAALLPVGRLAAEYTLADNVFTSPLPARVVESRRSARMIRLDEKPDGWSPIDQNDWTAAGNVTAP
jgi:flavin reductase (DIM6/NTAB) family NADH-FMN oxidoreductase RutF